MGPSIAFPFLTLSDFAIDAAPWSLSLNDDDWQPAGDFLPDWDAASSIRVRRQLCVDPKVAAYDLGVQPGSLRLSLSVSIGTGPGRLPRLILSRKFRELAEGAWKENFELDVPGEHLSQVRYLQTQVAMAVSEIGGGTLTPQRVGDRLWSDTLRICLEGNEPRFPIEACDMRLLLGDCAEASAPWYLDWSSGDWHRDFHGAVRLYLNESQNDFVERVVKQDELTLQVLIADVMNQICERLLNDPEAEIVMTEAESGSLGFQAASWLRKLWPSADAAFLRNLLESQPGKFRAGLLALGELVEM